MRQIFNVASKSLRDQRWQIVGYGLALLSMAAMIVFIWPSYRTAFESTELPQGVQAFLGSDLSYATAPGFVSGEFFSWIPVLLIVYAVVQGTGAIAGEEGSGTLDLLMAQPVARSTVALQKCLAFCVGAALVVALGFVGLPCVGTFCLHRHHASGCRRGIRKHAAHYAPVLHPLAVARCGGTQPRRGCRRRCRRGDGHVFRQQPGERRRPGLGDAISSRPSTTTGRACHW